MRIKKGEYGYLKKKKKWEITKTIFWFLVVVIIFAAGYITTKTRLNLLTVGAVLCALPACKSLVGVFMIWPHQGLEESEWKAIDACAGDLAIAYDLVLTSYEKVMPVASITAAGKTLLGYTKKKDLDLGFVQEHIRSMAEKNGYHVTVKIFTDQEKYQNRLTELNKLEQTEKEREQSRYLRAMLLAISL